jgi:beta-N-acetylhexosaminidase
MGEDAAGHDHVAGRRTFLKGVLATGAAALAGSALVGLDEASAHGGPPRRPGTTQSPEQMAGQRVVFSYAGLTVPDTLLAQIEAGEAGGVIFFGENITSEAQITQAIAQLRAAQKRSPVDAPLLLMTDQEGGEVRRLPGAPAWSEKEIGSSSDPAAEATQAGRRAGENLAGVTMNVNLAPVLDVFYKPGNFIDEYQRSYSDNATVASTCGRSMITAQQQTDVAATAKHFPGLGAATTDQDTDTGPVTLTQSLTELRDTDEYPYAAAIKAGVQLIMVSWAIYTALDKTHPAGLSEAIVQNELRSRHGFKGVTVTDALEAGALKPFGTISQRAVLAAGAGMDLILCSARDVAEGQEATSALAAALSRGTLRPGEFGRALGRVTALRHSLH